MKRVLTTLLIAILSGALAFWLFRKRTTLHKELVYVTRLPSGELLLREDPDHPQLQAFRKEEKIDDIIRPYKTDLDKLLALAKWSSQLFPATSPLPKYPPWNARIILDRIRKRETGGFCAQYALIFGQACQSLGYRVRYLDLSSPADNGGHFVTSLFVPEIDKYVMFDGSRGTYITDEHGVPLSSLELHAYAVGEKKGRLIERPSGKDVTPDYVALFYYIRYYLRTNFLSVPVFVKRTGPADNPTLGFEPYRLYWTDKYTAPMVKYADAIPTSNPGDFDYRIDWSKATPKNCDTVNEFFEAVPWEPPLMPYKITIPHETLVEAIKYKLIHNPNYQRLKS